MSIGRRRVVGRTVSQEKGGGLGGETTRSVIPLESLEIAGLTLTNVAGSIDEGDSASDLNVGISVLRHFVITADFRAHALWLEAVRGVSDAEHDLMWHHPRTRIRPASEAQNRHRHALRHAAPLVHGPPEDARTAA